MDSELLRKIDPDELSNGAWMKKNKVRKTKVFGYIYGSISWLSIHSNSPHTWGYVILC